jgi:hypothetical protein
MVATVSVMRVKASQKKQIKFALDPGELSALRGYVAEYVACEAFKRWLKRKYPEIGDKEIFRVIGCPLTVGETDTPCLRIWVPPPLLISPQNWGLTLRDIYRRGLLMPELEPLQRIRDNGGNAPDLVAEFFPDAGKVERYFIEVKSGKATLDERQKITMELARAEGYIPLIIHVRRMDLEGNSFDAVIEELGICLHTGGGGKMREEVRPSPNLGECEKAAETTLKKGIIAGDVSFSTNRTSRMASAVPTPKTGRQAERTIRPR